MNKVEFGLDYRDIEKLEAKFKRLPGRIENIINSYLHLEGATKMAKDITMFIRVSKADKRHAKLSKWWKVRPHNLGFEIVAKGGAANKKGSFGYLVFPNEGRGPRNPLEQRFFERGLERATPKLLQDMHELIDRKLEEELS
jgi:hypothetical protein